MFQNSLKCLVVLLQLLAAVNSFALFSLALDEWAAFKLQYGKKYTDENEDRFRMKVFLDNRRKIAQHNKGPNGFTMRMNDFGDLLAQEFTTNMNGFQQSMWNASKHLLVAGTFIAPENVDIPESIDWREKGAVTPVKNQGHCGSCWAFSSTGALEGQHFRKTGKLVSLSEQNLIDCTGGELYRNEGCNGGIMDAAFQYIQDNHGIDTEEGYPYEAKQRNCRYKLKTKGADDKGFVDVDPDNEEKLKTAVATVGPIAIAIDAGHESFQFYSKGIYYEASCSSKQLDHAVLLVGYGTDKESGHDYWLVKNSWGTKWGEDGYIRMMRNKSNNCGVASMPSYPIV